MTPRLLAILRLVPTAPATASTTTLVGELLALGYDVTPRTVQRDLADLARRGHVVAQLEHRPFGWSAGSACFECPTCLRPLASAP